MACCNSNPGLLLTARPTRAEGRSQNGQPWMWFAYFLWASFQGAQKETGLVLKGNQKKTDLDRSVQH